MSKIKNKCLVTLGIIMLFYRGFALIWTLTGVDLKISVPRLIWPILAGDARLIGNFTFESPIFTSIAF